MNSVRINRFVFSGIFLVILSVPGPVSGRKAVGSHPDSVTWTIQDGIRIDSVLIVKNWRTRKQIIRQELLIYPGDTVTRETLDKAVLRIWNIGNFAKVSWQLDTLENSSVLLIITAQDALTIMPDFSFSGNRKEYSLSAGINDENFLGRNIELNLAATFGTLAKETTIRLGIPRQLLYKNMTLRLGYTYGAEQYLRYRNGKPFSGVSYLRRDIFLSVGNPCHTDYHYTFSPDLTIEYLSHQTDSSLFRMDIPFPDDYRVQYLGFTLRETVGLINRTRHQSDGKQIQVSTAYYRGMDQVSPDYYDLSFSANYYCLLNRVVELHAVLSMGMVNSGLPSQIRYLGPDQVKGALTGERWGKAYISGGFDAGFTYLNRDWFALEHFVFLFTGNAAGSCGALFGNRPLFSAGTGLKLMVPMVPWLAVSMLYAFKGKNNHWLGIE